MLGAQLAPWRLWRSGLGQNGIARAASLDSAQTRSQGLRGLKKTVTLGAPWDIVTVNLITQLPPSINDNGNTWDAIMVVVDRLTKHAHFFPCGSDITAIQVATVFYKRIFPLHGLPCQIISN
jgi:hypothetical protein